MKKIKMPIIAITIIICLVIGIGFLSYIVKMKEREDYKYTYIWELAQRIRNNEIDVKNVDKLGIYATIDLVLSEQTLWDKLALTSSFKEKFNSPKEIIEKIDKYKNISVGVASEYNKSNVIVVAATEKESIISLFNKNIETDYYFEYILDDDNQLGDLILLKEVDIDSMTAETYDVREY